MSKTKHTPGPWIGGLECINDSRGRLLAVVEYESQSPKERRVSAEEGKANSRLIASAPDLLDALKKAVRLARLDCANPKCVCIQCGVKSQMLEAIKKAEGDL